MVFFMSLTPKQQQLLTFISDFQHEHGYAPSQKEIANHFGFRSLGTVQDYLVRLQQQGYLEKSWNGKRTLKVRDTRTTLPLMGKVAAGSPIEAIANQENIDVPESMLGSHGRNRGPLFALRVSGDSMIDEGILDGDYVVIKKQPTAENGNTVVALVDGEATIKRYYQHRNFVELQPANPAYQNIRVEAHQDFAIEGILVGLLRHID